MRDQILLAVGAAVLATFPVTLQGQGIRFHGIPASATSVGPNGESHGIPSSVTSPTFDNTNQLRFSNGIRVGQRRMIAPQSRHHRGQRIVAVPVYVPGYSLPYYMYEPEPVVEEQPADNQPPEPPARTIFERRSTTVTDDSEDTDSRYGEHYLDSREERRRKPAKAEETDEKDIAKASTAESVRETHS